VAYRALAQHFEHFLQVYQERFEPAFGYLRSAVKKAVYRYLDCGILESGFARLRCDGCGQSAILAFSCKQRCVCASCHQKRELLWAEWATEELLEDMAHRQVVFTIPKRLRIYFRYDRKLLGELASCAWRALKLYAAAYFDRSDIALGGVGFIQTAGELLRFHPHIHILMADGAWLPDGSFRHLLYFDSDKIEKLFRAVVLRTLVENGRIDEATVSNLLSWSHSGFSVHGGVCVETREDAARLGRYMIRCPLVLDRLHWDAASAEVVYHAKPRSKKNSRVDAVARWDVLDFIARLTQHIPDTSEQLLRYWGFYSNASRGKRLKAPRGGQPEDQQAADTTTATRPYRPRTSWARLIRKVYEIDPLLCAYCGGQLRIVACLTDLGSIHRFLAGTKAPAQQPQPLAHSPPTGELLFDTA